MAKTKKELLPIVKFISEEDRQTFCKLFSEALKTEDIAAEINKKTVKNRSFSIKLQIADFKKIGLDPSVVFHFKKVRKSQEYDLDIEVRRLDGSDISEYFDSIENISQ